MQVTIVRPDQCDDSTPQTAGMKRIAGLSPATAGTQGLWMGIATNEPGAMSGVHHHGDAESGIYVLEGAIIFRWGTMLEHEDVANAGDFIFVPPRVIHLEENMSKTEPVKLLLARNATEVLVINVPDPREREEILGKR